MLFRSYDRVERYDSSPAQLAEHYEKSGAKRIHIVDLNGAKDGKLSHIETLKEIRKQCSCEIEYGGGIRSLESVQNCFELGIDYVVLGSLLTKDFALSKQIIQRFEHKVIAGLDTKNNVLAIEGWRKAADQPLESLVNVLNTLPIESIIHTDIDTDGMLTGPNLNGLKQLCQKSKHPIIASGGVGSIEDVISVKELAKEGISGCIIGKAILSNKIPLQDLFQL